MENNYYKQWKWIGKQHYSNQLSAGAAQANLYGTQMAGYYGMAGQAMGGMASMMGGLAAYGGGGGGGTTTPLK